MKFLIILFLTLHYSFAFSQQVQNVKVVQSDEATIQITYDLNDAAGKPYYVKLLMSKDDGKTFGGELIYVRGDVKNTQAGIGKKIIWDAKKEISYYEGNAVFRVEAALKHAELPEPIEQNCAKIELLNVKAVGSKLTIDFNVIATENQFATISYEKLWTNIIDSNGNEFAASDGRLGDTRLGGSKKLLVGIPVKSQLVFENVNQSVKNAAQLQIRLWSNDCNKSEKEQYFVFNNIPISR
jgi:hypothetical protein